MLKYDDSLLNKINHLCNFKINHNFIVLAVTISVRTYNLIFYINVLKQDMFWSVSCQSYVSLQWWETLRDSILLHKMSICIKTFIKVLKKTIMGSEL
jgi:hypothetical protein